MTKSGGDRTPNVLTTVEVGEQSDPSQNWSITPDPSSGAFIFKNVQAGRCLDVPNGSTANGTLIQIYDCWGPSSQKLFIQAFPLS